MAQQDIILKLREGAKVERVGAAATPAKPDEPKKP